jgi:hypothetical protein
LDWHGGRLDPWGAPLLARDRLRAFAFAALTRAFSELKTATIEAFMDPVSEKESFNDIRLCPNSRQGEADYVRCCEAASGQNDLVAYRMRIGQAR